MTGGPVESWPGVGEKNRRAHLYLLRERQLKGVAALTGSDDEGRGWVLWIHDARAYARLRVLLDPPDGWDPFG